MAQAYICHAEGREMMFEAVVVGWLGIIAVILGYIADRVRAIERLAKERTNA